MDPRVALCAPFPAASIPQLWAWLQEFPDANFDDDGPRTLEEFTAQMQARIGSERTCGAEAHGELCGAIGYRQLDPQAGLFRGICFARRVHGTGIARAAVSQVIAQAFAEGTQRIYALHFADNVRVHRLLLALGARAQAVLPRWTRRHGQPLDVRLVVFSRS